jgi:hypothetical protein
MDGIIIHKETFLEVGDFANTKCHMSGVGEMEFIKLGWSLKAIEKGCVMKGIIGMRAVW